MDLALRDCRIIDGSGAPSVNGDIGITDGRIVAIGRVDERAREELSIGGAVAAPGFIDVHTHYDAQAFWDPYLSPSVFHGTTTALAGNCGFTLAPLSGRPEDTEYLIRMLSRVEGMPLAALHAGLRPDWKSFGEYLARLEGKLAINTGFMVGHSALRRAVMGERAVGEKANDDELRAMLDLLGRSLSEGGLGFSTTVAPSHNDLDGRPVPSRWASREELIALAGRTGEYPGTYLEIVIGLLDFSEREHSLMSDMSLAAQRAINWNVLLPDSTLPQCLRSQLGATDYARERGADVFGLVQANPSKLCLNFNSGFVLDTMPDWPEILALPHERKRAALADPEVRKRLASAPSRATSRAVEWVFGDWAPFTLEETFLPENQIWRGKTLGEYARAMGKDPLTALFDLVVAEDLRTSFAPPPKGNDIESWQMRSKAWTDNERCVVGGSDAGAHLDMINAFALTTNLLSIGVRERKLIKLEEAVRQLTRVPAERFGLVGRGRLEVGTCADITVFDPQSVGSAPVEMRRDLPGGGSRLYADAIGVPHVIVNGVGVVRDGKATGRMGGRMLRSGRDTQTVALRKS